MEGKSTSSVPPRLSPSATSKKFRVEADGEPDPSEIGLEDSDLGSGRYSPFDLVDGGVVFIVNPDHLSVSTKEDGGVVNPLALPPQDGADDEHAILLI